MSSSRQAATAIVISHNSVQRAAREFDLHPYRPTSVVELSKDDLARRVEFYEAMLKEFHEDSVLVEHILWSDKSEFKLNETVNRHDYVYWARKNLHATLPIRNTQKGVIVWCGITSTQIIGPYFFDDSVDTETYLAMLNQFL